MDSHMHVPTLQEVEYMISTTNTLRIFDRSKKKGELTLKVRKKDESLAQSLGVLEVRVFVFDINKLLKKDEITVTEVMSGQVKTYYRTIETNWMFIERTIGLVH